MSPYTRARLAISSLAARGSIFLSRVRAIYILNSASRAPLACALLALDYRALVFLLHPAQTESVAWISALSNPLYLCFYLSSSILFLRWRRDGSPRTAQMGYWAGGPWHQALTMLVGFASYVKLEREASNFEIYHPGEPALMTMKQTAAGIDSYWARDVAARNALRDRVQVVLVGV